MIFSCFGSLKCPGKWPWLPLILMISVIMGMGGCASTPSPVAAPPAPPRKVPVKVTTTPVKPERKVKKDEKPKIDLDMDERGIERYTKSLKEIPQVKRAPAPGEKVFPIDLNLKNADLVEAVRVLAETLGLNYSIDPKVKGTVNVRASGKLSESELLSIMETLLNVNGATMVKTGKIIKVVPLDKASTQPLPVYSRGPAPPGMRAQVVFLEQTVAKEMVPVLKPLLTAGGSISEAAHNALIITDTPDNLDKLLQLIHLVDTRALSQTLVRLFKVHNTDPHEIIGELETIFTAYGTLGQKGKFGASFLPVSRLNSVMILANSPPLMERALYWVRQLDMKTDLLANVHVYHVENYKAKNLANLLTQVYGGQPAAPTIKESKPDTGTMFGGGMGSRSGMGGTGGMGGGGLGGIGGRGSLSGGGGFGASTSESPSASSTAPGAAPGDPGATPRERAAPGAAGGAGGGTSPKEGVRIIPDEENNLLVVVAPPHEWNIISRILKSLDVMPRQVLNEVLIAEVRLSDELKYGVEFLLGLSPTAPTTTTGTDSTSTTTTTTVPAAIPGLQVLTGAAAAFSGLGGLTFVISDAANKFRALINLLASQGRADILASPHIMAANNQEARIQIGEDVPIKTSESVPLISQTTSFQTSTVQYRSTGIILSVKPQINAKGQVTMEITQEVSSAQELRFGETSPRISVRQAKTVLTTADNQTVVLGGLIREDRIKTKAGIPGLSKIPLLGSLFGSEGVKKEKTELLVLITPRIVANLEDGARITHEMKDRMGLEETPQRGPGAPRPGAPPQ